MKTAIIFGASGAVGSQLLSQLANSNNYQLILVPTRKYLSCESFDNDKVKQLPINGEIQKTLLSHELAHELTQAAAVADIFCCLGSTIKKAGSRKAFAQIDLDLVVDIGRWAKEQEVNSFHVISSLGADAESDNFYLSTKGKMEQALASLVFTALFIYRPSLLSGAKRSEFRLGETLALAIMYPLHWLPFSICQGLTSVNVNQVAKAMLVCASGNKGGVQEVESEQIRRLAKE